MSYFGDSGSGCGSYSNNRNCESVDGNSEIEMRFESDSGGSADESHNHLMGEIYNYKLSSSLVYKHMFSSKYIFT